MELVAKETYHSGLCSLYPGDTTIGKGLPEEVKTQMLADFPNIFGVVSGKAPAKEEPVEATNQEDKMVVENQEDKMPKMRKK